MKLKDVKGSLKWSLCCMLQKTTVQEKNKVKIKYTKNKS